jgi:hypothetical protein
MDFKNKKVDFIRSLAGIIILRTIFWFYIHGLICQRFYCDELLGFNGTCRSHIYAVDSERPCMQLDVEIVGTVCLIKELTLINWKFLWGRYCCMLCWKIYGRITFWVFRFPKTFCHGRIRLGRYYWYLEDVDDGRELDRTAWDWDATTGTVHSTGLHATGANRLQ